MARMAIQVNPISVALAVAWRRDTYMDSGYTWARYIPTDSGCGVGPQTQARPWAARWTWTSPWPWVARGPSTSAFSSPLLRFFSFTSSHSMWMILLLFLPHFSATNLLIIMDLSSPSLEDPGWLMGGLCPPKLNPS